MNLLKGFFCLFKPKESIMIIQYYRLIFLLAQLPFEIPYKEIFHLKRISLKISKKRVKKLLINTQTSIHNYKVKIPIINTRGLIQIVQVFPPKPYSNYLMSRRNNRRSFKLKRGILDMRKFLNKENTYVNSYINI